MVFVIQFVVSIVCMQYALYNSIQFYTNIWKMQVDSSIISFFCTHFYYTLHNSIDYYMFVYNFY